MRENRIKRIEYSNKFLKALTRLPKRIISKAKEKEIIFKENVFDPRLKTHKLSGKDKKCWAFSITDSCRIKFIFLPNREILFLEIGLHDIYK